MRTVRLDRIDERRWRVTIDGHRLSSNFLCERDARDAGADEVVRLDGIALALLRRARAGLSRKRP